MAVWIAPKFSIVFHLKLIALAVLVAFAVLCNWTEGCDDVSKQACKDLMSSNSDLCNDACLSSVCARTCGKCTLKCYSCHEVNRPEDCNTTLECPSSDYQCISVKSFTGLFQEVYKLGCAPGNVFRHFQSSPEMILKFRILEF
uniref:Snake toxin/toxin-like domain-containing protein n=1 Tax=Magallana gigas TaxID=29159 RepID=K1RA50_MAGGI